MRLLRVSDIAELDLELDPFQGQRRWTTQPAARPATAVRETAPSLPSLAIFHPRQQPGATSLGLLARDVIDAEAEAQKGLGSLPQTTPLNGGLRIYVKTHTVEWGKTVIGCAAFDKSPNQVPIPCAWRIVQVRTMAPAEKLPNNGGIDFRDGMVPDQVVPLLNGVASVAGVDARKPFNREQRGYEWPEVIKVAIPPNSPQGLYAIQMTILRTDPSPPKWTDPHVAATAYFVVRSQQPTSPVLFCWPFTTLAVYSGRTTTNFSNIYEWGEMRRAHRVAIERPFDITSHQTDFTAKDDKKIRCLHYPLLLSEVIGKPPISMNVDHCTDFDFIFNPTLFDRFRNKYQLVILAGHDEYWPKEKRDFLDQFVQQGGNIALFTGNTAFCQVRFEKRYPWETTTIVCHKTLTADPAVDTDPSHGTALWAGNPTNGPANTTNGVGATTLGGLDAHKYTVVGPLNDPFLANAKSTFPDDTTMIPAINDNDFGLLGYECDGCDFVVDGKPPKFHMPIQSGAYTPTGLDGTPASFTILAVADLSFRSTKHPSKDPNIGNGFLGKDTWTPLTGGVHTELPGWAVMGYYQNNGTVFSASTTEWANALTDPSVAAITRNVVVNLSKPYPTIKAFQQPNGPEQLPIKDKNNDPFPWVPIKSDFACLGVAATLTGELILMEPDGSLVKRDALNPTASAETKLPCKPLPILPHFSVALSSDLYGGRLHAVARDGTKTKAMVSAVHPDADHWEDAGVERTAPDWLQSITFPARYWGMFVAKDREGVWLRTAYNTQHRVGRFPYGYSSRNCYITSGGFDSLLYTFTPNDEIVCRETSGASASPELANFPNLPGDVTADLVWRKVAEAPRGIFSLAVANGRLYALSGSPENATLWWRWAVAAPIIREPSVVLLHETLSLTLGGPPDPSVIQGMVASSGDITDWRRVTSYENFQLNIKRSVPSIPYSSPQGAGSFQPLAARAGKQEILFCGTDGSGELFRFFEDAVKNPDLVGAWPQGSFMDNGVPWTCIVYVGGDAVFSATESEYVLFYQQKSGLIIIGTFETVTGKPGDAIKAPPNLIEVSRTKIDDLGEFTDIVAANDAPSGKYILFYNRFTGKWLVGILSNGVFARLSDTTSQAATLAVLQQLNAWKSVPALVDENGNFRAPLDTGTGSLLRSGWTTLTAIGQDYILLYDRSSGEVLAVEFNFELNILRQVWIPAEKKVFLEDAATNPLPFAHIAGTETGIVFGWAGVDCFTVGIRSPDSVITEGPNIAPRATWKLEYLRGPRASAILNNDDSVDGPVLDDAKEFQQVIALGGLRA